jgi:DnaJ like chaperone protein
LSISLVSSLIYIKPQIAPNRGGRCNDSWQAQANVVDVAVNSRGPRGGWRPAVRRFEQMGWMGKIIGGTIGFAMGGPLGAVAGAVFGHAFDSSNDFFDAEEKLRLSSGEESQMTFFVAAFSMLAKLVQSNGRMSQAELDTIEGFMQGDLRLSPESRHIASNIFQAALNSPGTFEQFAAQFYQHFHFQPQMLELMLDILLRVATSDGNLSPNEEKFILSAATAFHFSQDRYHSLKSRYIDDLARYYGVLGCTAQDSDDQVKRQYRKMVQEYHPDKIAAKGLPDEFTKFAADKFREIQEAYERIKQQRNLK